MQVRFFGGTKAEYLSLATPRNPLGLYFCVDTRELFWGDKLLTDGTRVVSTFEDLPSFEEAADGITYFVEDTHNGYVVSADRTKWVQVIFAPESPVKAISFAGIEMEEVDGVFTIDRRCAREALGFKVSEGMEDAELEIATPEYVAEQIAKISGADLNLSEYVKHEDLEDYATEQYVIDAIAEQAAKKEEVAEVKTTLEKELLPIVPTVEKVEKELLPTVQSLSEDKADKVLFTTSKFVTNPIGSFVEGEDLNGLTLATLFAKLLGLSDTDPNEKPIEPDIPDPDVPETVVDIIADKINTATESEPVSVMQTITESGEFVEVLQTEILLLGEHEAIAAPVAGANGFYQIKDEAGNVVESGFQELQIESDSVYYAISLPKEIDYNTMITLQAYNSGDGPIAAGWYSIPKYNMLSSRENLAEVLALCEEMDVTEARINDIHNAGYTLWITESTPDGSKVRYVITNIEEAE